MKTTAAGAADLVRIEEKGSGGRPEPGGRRADRAIACNKKHQADDGLVFKAYIICAGPVPVWGRI